jgi:hypothetical protein
LAFRPLRNSTSSLPPRFVLHFHLLDPLSDVGWTWFDFDAVLLATTQKIYGFLADERDIRQIQDQVLAFRFRAEQLSQVIDVCRLDAPAELEQDTTLSRTLNFEHANSPMPCDAR